MDNKTQPFDQIPLSRVRPGKELPCDVYLRINDKFIRYLGTGDALESSKFNYFMAKSLQYFYIDQSDSIKFKNWMELIRIEKQREALKEIGEEHLKIWEANQKVEEKVYEALLSDDVSDQQMEEIQSCASDFIKMARQYKTTVQVVAQLSGFNSSLAGHSLNVANLAVFCALIMGKAHQYLLENIYLGAILHDYGKIKIDPHILDNKSDAIYSHAINNHPIEGAKMLKKLKSMPAPVFMIIEQHEEMYDGSGYPRGLKGTEMYELASIVSFANALENIISENVSKLRVGQNKEEAYVKSLKAIALHPARFHPFFMDKGIEFIERALIQKSAIELEFEV